MRYLLVISFNTPFMEENIRPRNLSSLSSMVKPHIGLERGGKVNLCIITEIILTQFYNPNNNLMI